MKLILVNNDVIDFISNVGIENVEIVNLESAKYIKNLGFNKPTHYYWLDKDLPFVDKGLKRVKLGKRRMNHNKYDDFIYSAPTKRELLDWFERYFIPDKIQKQINNI